MRSALSIGRTSRLFLLAAVLWIGAQGVPASPALAQFNPSWQSPEVIDAPVTVVPSPSGTPLVHDARWAPWSGADRWHAFYVKNGQILRRVRNAGAWDTPEIVVANPVNAHDPAAAFGQNRLHLVWVEDRTGRAEVWTRDWDGTAWSAETCLSDDAVPSTAAVIAGSQDGAYAAWEDEVTGHRVIRGRGWTAAAGWGAIETISDSPAEALHPALVAEIGSVSAAWADTRHGARSIYVRTRPYGSWLPAVRATAISGNSDYPVIQAGTCCGDMLDHWLVVLFQNDSQGVSEVWRCCLTGDIAGTPIRFSSNDGIPSSRPSLAGFVFDYESGPAWGLSIRSFGTWADQTGSVRRHPLMGLSTCENPADLGTITVAGESNAIMAADEGSPWAALGNLWIAEAAGQPSLMFRAGTALSCWHVGIVDPWRIVLGPEGSPTTNVTIRNLCGGVAPLPGVPVRLVFDNVLNSHLTWDVQQPHPQIEQTTDAEGVAAFAIRGGGCWPTGTVNMQINGVTMRTYTGATSPDIDGDCAVGEDDLAYVQSKLGTSDFCADLDGSGTVGTGDVSIVQAALGDLCSQMVGVEEPNPAASAGNRLRAVPNPAAGALLFRFELKEPASVEARIHDAGGRLVRAIDPLDFPAGPCLLRWDGRDAGGQEAPAGAYFALVRYSGGKSARTTFFIVR